MAEYGTGDEASIKQVLDEVDKNKKKGARSSRLRRLRPLWVLCTQTFPAFLQDF
jgi:hypothetical protein